MQRTLENRWSNAFSDDSRRRGLTAFASGRVEVVESSTDAFTGRFTSPESCESSLKVHYLGDGVDLGMSCSCQAPFASPCQHLWALTLAADEQQWGRRLLEADDAAQDQAGRGEAAGDDGDDDRSDEDDDDRSDEDDDDRSDEDDDEGHAAKDRGVWATRGRGQLPQRTPPPDWRSLLAELEVTSAAELARRSAGDAGAPPDRECWLILNTGETLLTQQVQLDCMERKRRLNGDWGIYKPAVCTLADFLPRGPQAQSSIIRALLSATPATPATRDELRGSRRFSSVALDPGMDPGWWKTLAREVKLGIASQSVDGRQVLPAAVDAASLWTDELTVERAKSGRDWVISLRLRRDDAVAVRPFEPLVVFPSGLVVFKDSLAWMRPRSAAEFQWLALLHKRPRLTVPDEQLDRLIGKLLLLQTAPRLVWSAEAVRERRAWTEETQTPTPILRLGRGVLTMTGGDRVALGVAFAYGGGCVEAGDPREVLALDRERHLLRRDLGCERRLVDALLDLGGPSVQRAEGGSLTMPGVGLVGLVALLEAAGWQIELERARVRPALRTAVQVSSGVDWFDLAAVCDFGVQSVGLPALLAAIEARSPFVALTDGTVGMLPSAWLQRFSTLAQHGRPKAGHLRFAQAQIAFLSAVLGDLPSVTTDAAFAATAAKLSRFAAIAPAAPPATFVGELRPYQQEGLGWLRFLRDFGFGGCLADDMGLGKTVQVLAAMPPRGSGPSLVVVPRSLVHNWLSEAARFRPDLRVLSYDACDRKAVAKVAWAHDLVVATYGCLRRDVGRLRQVEFDTVVLDEAQAIKNRDSQTARACRLLSARHRLAMTGTPVENRLEDLVSLFEFLNPGMLTPSTFRRACLRGAAAEAPHELVARALRPFILRRTKDQVLTDLPEKTEQTIYCELGPDQRAAYEELRVHYQAHLMKEVAEDGMERSKFHVLAALLRLRQAACHPGLLDAGRVAEPSAKLEVLVEHLLDLSRSGHRALVFSQFTSLLAIVRARLGKEGIAHQYLDGQTRDRERRVRSFQADDAAAVFLVSLKAGGVGLNLTAADYCFLLDPWWNPAVEQQAIARAHRIGQVRPVFAYRLIARGTVEEKILELQANKRGLADGLVNADNAVLSGMSLEDLRVLLD